MFSHVSVKSQVVWHLIIPILCILAITAIAAITPQRAFPANGVWAPASAQVSARQSLSTTTSVVGYAYVVSNTGCVPSNGPATVVFKTINQGSSPKTVIVEPSGIATLGEDLYMSPATFVDTTKSGLTKTARLPVWHWTIKVMPGQSVEKPLYVLDTGSAYFGPWDPSWGPLPVPRFYTNGTGYVRHSTDMVSYQANPAYCKGK